MTEAIGCGGRPERWPADLAERRLSSCSLSALLSPLDLRTRRGQAHLVLAPSPLDVVARRRIGCGCGQCPCTVCASVALAAVSQSNQLLPLPRSTRRPSPSSPWSCSEVLAHVNAATRHSRWWWWWSSTLGRPLFALLLCSGPRCAGLLARVVRSSVGILQMAGMVGRRERSAPRSPLSGRDAGPKRRVTGCLWSSSHVAPPSSERPSYRSHEMHNSSQHQSASCLML